MRELIYNKGIIFGLGGIILGIIALILFQAILKAEHLYQVSTQHWPYLSLLLTPCGFIIISWLIQKYFNGAQGSGIPQVLHALKFSKTAKSYVSLRILLGKCLMVPAYLCGASLGYEGPAVQIGASLMISFYEHFKIEKEKLRRSLIIAGGAAGLAAAFCAPLTGIVFAIEELSKQYKGKINSYILVTIIFAGLICEIFIGHYIYLGMPTDENDSHLLLIANYWLIPVCGVIGGGLGSIFSLILINSCKKLYGIAPRKIFCIAGISGLLCAIINLISHNQTAGCGAAQISTLFAGHSLVAAFVPLKALATLLTYLSGLPTGLFAPSLAIGAGLSQVVLPFLPASVNIHALIILMMVGYLCGVTQAPLTSFTIVMEITGQDALILPLIATSLIAKFVANLIVKVPLYESLMWAASSKLPLYTKT